MRYALVNGHVLDGTLDESGRMVAHDGWAVLVDGERIVDVGDLRSSELMGYELVDLAGAWVMPGLIDLHVHIASAGKAPRANAKPIDYKALYEKLSKHPLVIMGFRTMCADLARTQLLSGTTTIRCVGGILEFDGKIRDRVNEGRLLGPRMLVCNQGISVPGGHFAGSLATEASSPEEAAEHVRQIAQTNPDWIKLMITGGVMDSQVVGEPGALRMPPETVRAACAEAHKLGYRVAAHVESTEGVRVALENGVDTIEHGAPLDDELLELFRERGAVDVCTLSPNVPYTRFPLEESHATEVNRENAQIVMDGVTEGAKSCLAAGVTVGLGTDAGCHFITHYDMWRELAYFVELCGVTPDFALHTATLVNANILGLGDETGSIEAGKSADLIVCAENPLEDFSRLRNLDYVICRGRMVRDPRPFRIPAVDRALERYV